MDSIRKFNSSFEINGTSPDMRASTNQFKFMQERINTVEKHFGEICHYTAAYARKNAKLRDGGDNVAKIVLNFAESETLNRTTRLGLTHFSDNLAAVQDYKQTQITRLDAKVVQELSSYGPICRQARDDLRTSYAAKQKELHQKKRLDRIRSRNPMNRQQISQAEVNLQHATSEASRYSQTLMDQMDNFERKKLNDVKKIFMDFAKIEMAYHAKALELFTKAYDNMASACEDEDLEEFRNCLRITRGPSQQEILSKSANNQDANLTTGSLNNTGNSSAISSVNTEDASTPIHRYSSAR